MLKHIIDIYTYRDMISSLVRRDLRGRYKGSLLGFAWNLINPLCQMIVYYFIFSQVFRSGIEAFHVYLMIGMFPWNFFSEALNRGSSAVLGSADMVKKIYFPREVLPISVVTSSFVNLLLTYIVLFGVMFLTGFKPPVRYLYWLPVLWLVEYVMALGFALILSITDVYFRDIQHITSVILMAWIWMCPIMYDFTALEDGLVKKIVMYNPMTPLILGFQNVLYRGEQLDIGSLGYAAAWAAALLVAGELVFIHLQKEIAGEL